jgi:hypothetical protein
MDLAQDRLRDDDYDDDIYLFMLLTYFDFHSPFISVKSLLFSSSSSSSFHTYNSVNPMCG